MFKRAKVVMLATNKEATDKPFSIGLTLFNTGELNWGNPVSRTESRYDLYITSEEEIKEGDWFLTDTRNNINENHGLPKWELKRCTSIFHLWIGADHTEDEGYNPDWSKKVIASTNSNLTTGMTEGNVYYISLPQPSQSFINKYIEEYNKGNIITDVMVEYEEDGFIVNKSFPMSVKNILHLKVNPKDNTITIKK